MSVFCPPQIASPPALSEWLSSEQVCSLAAATVETSLEFTASMKEHPALLVAVLLRKTKALCAPRLQVANTEGCRSGRMSTQPLSLHLGLSRQPLASGHWRSPQHPWLHAVNSFGDSVKED